MSEQIREQVSAFFDGELPNSETELLLKRLTRDAELRESFGRYALIGECLRGDGHARLSKDFHFRVNRAIDAEPISEALPVSRMRRERWWRSFAGAALAAGVAAMAVLALQQRAVVPTVLRAEPLAAALSITAPVMSVSSKEPISYTVPAAVADAPSAMPAARLTNYVFAHSQYSSVLGQHNVLSGLLTDSDDRAASKDARHP